MDIWLESFGDCDSIDWYVDDGMVSVRKLVSLVGFDVM
jgi:hypothetical protein